ncbi:MAG: hypothetical protein K0Q95_1879 [Bacteroidota bacterium]|jgi:RimJ/RimL family protein N-acetyltransferase|nr:hypothetical protein [Bacteroidota bacterium]
MQNLDRMKKTDDELSVRELTETDISLIADYWLTADSSFLEGMGVDLNKLPSRGELSNMLLMQLQTPLVHKRSFCMIWELNGNPVGHSNVNPMQFGEEATMHLHLWKNAERKRGMGSELVRLTLPHFFEKLQLKKLISEPYALNPAPNKTLEKVGFEFVKEYITIPGSLNFEQPVKRWEMTLEHLKKSKQN